MKIITNYKHFTIYEKDNHIYYRNINIISAKPKSILSAKNLITRRINKMSERQKQQLKYLEFERGI